MVIVRSCTTWLLGSMIAYLLDTYQAPSIMRWDRGTRQLSLYMNIWILGSYIYIYISMSLSLYIYIHVHSRRFKNWYLWLNYRALARKTFLEGKKPCLSMYMHSKTSGYLVIPLVSHPKWMVFIRYFFSGRSPLGCSRWLQ